MAQYPCDRHGGRYLGPQNMLYASAYDGSYKWSRSYRLCGSCLEAAIEPVQRRMLPWHEIYGDTVFACLACGAETADAMVTATWYQLGDPEKRWGTACHECADRMAETLGMPPGAGQARD